MGAGFAGLASATLLARAGHQVTVLEKFAQPKAVGAGVLVQPTGLAAIRQIGIEEVVLAHGARVDRLYGVNPRGQRVVDIQYQRWRPTSFGLGLHRGVLFNALWRAAQVAGVVIETGTEVRRLGDLGQFDMRVMADGANSQLRQQTGVSVRDTLYPWGAVWAVLPDPDRHYGSTLWQWYRQANQMLGIMPTGLAPGSDVPVVSLFWSVRANQYQALQDSGLHSWKNSVLALNPACAELLCSITSLDQLTWAGYHDVVMPRYHTSSDVVIGDAAHATSPQLGQGTNLALLDALALARSVERADDVASALADYTRIRKGHLHFYSQASRLLTPLFQSNLTVLPWLRDGLMAQSVKWPLVKGMNLQTLVGVRKAWWGGTLNIVSEL